MVTKKYNMSMEGKNDDGIHKIFIKNYHPQLRTNIDNLQQKGTYIFDIKNHTMILHEMNKEIMGNLSIIGQSRYIIKKIKEDIIKKGFKLEDLVK